MNFKTYFSGKDDAYILLEGKNYQTVKGALTADHYQQHLEGKLSLGVIPIDKNNNCRFAVIDDDSHHNQPDYKYPYNKLLKKIKLLRLPLTVYKSKSGGAHIKLLLDKPYPAEKVRKVCKKFAYQLCEGAYEVFPKQDKLNSGETGSAVNLPYHNGNTRVAIDNEGNPLNVLEAMKYESNRRVKLDELKPFYRLSDKEFTEGYNNRLFSAANFLKKNFPESDWQNDIRELNKTYTDPIDAARLENTVISSVDKKLYAEDSEPEELPKELVDYDVKEFLQLPIEVPKWIVKNLIRQETINFICAPKGIGKSEFILGMLWAITTGQPFLNWEIKEAHPCNYIDFEMGRHDCTERLQKYANRFGYGPDNYLKINHFSLQEHQNIPDIKNEGGQKLILQRLQVQEKQTGKKPVVVIDNLRSASSYKENNSDDFRPIGIFFRDLRALGYTVIVIDHTGKDAKAGVRGSSSKTDWANIVLLGERAGPKGQKCMKIKFEFDKARGLRPDQTADFVCEYDLAGNWKLAATDKELKDVVLSKKVEEIQMKHPKITQEQIGDIVGKSAGTVNKIIKGINAKKKEEDEYLLHLKERLKN